MKDNKPRYYGGIEAGGTKFICLVGSSPEQILGETRIDTRTPDETFRQVIDFFEPYVVHGEISTIGVGSFGPVDLDPASPTFGYITTTPKPGWQNTDVAGRLRNALKVDVAFNTDVNTAALGEYRWGASRGFDPSFYLTVGTGIGAGYIQDGRPLIGLLSPEMGHIRIPHDLKADPFAGACPFHGDCFEGLASGPALEKRFHTRGETLPEDDPFWEIETGYIAFALVNYILTLFPRKIVLGGGIMQRVGLFRSIRKKVMECLNGYARSSSLLEHIDEYILPPGLGNRSGVLGAIALAESYASRK